MTTAVQALTDRDLCAALTAAAVQLPEKDQGFALSLVGSVTGRGYNASTKQRFWLETLLDRAQNGEPERIKTKVGEFKGIADLFERAKKKLKAPAIVIDIAGREIRLNVAGAKARVPGSVNVTGTGTWDERVWFGRILATGEFEASPRDPTPAGMVEGLARFAAAPAEVAAEHGRLTGRCCFCNRELTDERSTAVGYGPQCAGAYGLAWGARLSKTELFEAAAA